MLILLLFQISQSIYTSTLIDQTQSLNCSISKGQTSFVDSQYFYHSLSDNMAKTNLDQMTFLMWININQNYIMGSQVLFSFVDGYIQSAQAQVWINIHLYLKQSNGNFVLGLINGQLTNQPIHEIQIGQKMNKNHKFFSSSLTLGYWTQIVLSIDQSTSHTYLNVKYSNSLVFYQYQQSYLDQQLFKYKFTPQSRVTNEAFNDQDTRLCGSIAQFQYINGWTTMDSQPHVNYFSNQIYFLKSLSTTIDLGGQFTQDSKTGIINNNPGIKYSRNGQIRYKMNLLNELKGFTLAFWLYQSISSSTFQLVSFTDELYQQVQFGLGINQNVQLHLYSYQSDQTTYINQGWIHVIVNMRRQYNDKFQLSPNNSICDLYVNGTYVNTYTQLTIPFFNHMVIGQIQQQSQNSEYIYLQDIKLFDDTALIVNNNEVCLLMAGISQYCLFTRQFNHYALDSPNPSSNYNISSKLYFICPIRTIETSNCITTTINNCLRQISQACIQCDLGYKVQQNICVIDNQIIITKQDCRNNAIFCVIVNQYHQPIVCNDNQKLSGSVCIVNQVQGNCLNKLYLNNQELCYRCIGLTQDYSCVQDCVTSNSVNKFQDGFQCVSFCPHLYDYWRDCDLGKSLGRCVDQCDQGGSSLNDINCIYSGQKLLQGKTISCWYYSNSFGLLVKNYAQILNCDSSCQYCYHSGSTNCLSCSNPKQYFNPYTTSCVNYCDPAGILKYSNTLNQQCVSICPTNTLTLEYFCVVNCPNNYYQYQQTCIQIPPVSSYINDIVYDCPELCAKCTLSQCTSCVSNFPVDGNICVFRCYPKYLSLSTNQCQTLCSNKEYSYFNSNFIGYQFSLCFKDSCGKIQADILYQTVNHQSVPNKCMLPCDDGYFVDLIYLKCTQCDYPCQTCQGSGSYCLTCQIYSFLQNNKCITSCPSPLLNDYVLNQCSSSCIQGYTIQDQMCVQKCGIDKALNYQFQYQLDCYEFQPIHTYSIQDICYDCSPICKECLGPDINECSSCYSGTFYYQQKCVQKCPNLNDRINNICVDQCSVDQLVVGIFCDNQCDQNNYLYENICYTVQPSNLTCTMIQELNYSKCYPCYAQCNSCYDIYPQTCSSCINGYYLYQNTCITKCPYPYNTDKINNLCLLQCPLASLDYVCVDYCDGQNYIVFNQNICFTQRCSDGYYTQLNICHQCDSKCQTCQDSPKNCQLCVENYYLLNGSQCVKSCGLSLFASQFTWECLHQCPIGSFIQEDQINNNLICTPSCPQVVYNLVCLSQCPQKTYQDNGNYCIDCNGLCSKCTSAVYCTNCLQGYYLDQNQCIVQCPIQRQYIDFNTQTCIAQCNHYLYGQFCLVTCPSYLYYYLTKCVNQCPPLTYVNNQNCQQCNPICISCFGTLTSECMSCTNGYYLNGSTCQTTCPNLYDKINKICRNNCPSDQYYYGNQCVSSCPQLINQQYCASSCPSNTYIQNQYCMLCNSICKLCNGPLVSDCSQCLPNYFIDGTTCVQQCPNLSDMSSFQCVNQCSINQVEVVDQHKCLLQCPIGFYLLNSKCYTSCPVGSYIYNGQCQSCPSQCLQCLSSSICTQCQPLLVLDNLQCKSSCSNPDLFFDPFNQVCQSRCPLPLLMSQPPLTNYNICVKNCYLEYNQFCIQSCPDGMFEDSGTCLQCPSECIICTSQLLCTECQIGYYLNQQQCTLDCLPNYLDRVQNICVLQCDPNLIQYQGLCLINCPGPTFQISNQCYDDCPNNTYRDGNQCYNCHEYCKVCFGQNQNQCQICEQGYYMDGTSCVTSCPIYTDIVQNRCAITCDTKQYIFNNECIDNCNYLTNGQYCYQQCPSNTYQLLQICVDCPVGCQFCSQYGCDQCQLGYYLYNYLCTTICQNFYDDVNLQCVDVCPQDTVTYFSNCVSTCPYGSAYQNICVNECPIQTYSLNSICINCSERCQQCISLNQCILCQGNYQLFNGQCIVQCNIWAPQQYLGQCYQTCPDNTYKQENTCVQYCNLIIYNNECISQCPYGWYGTKVCYQCQSECQSCLDINNCQSCNQNYFLEGKLCVKSCPNISDTINQICSDSCSKFLYKSVCYSNCPSIQLGSQCVDNCPIGYFINNKICSSCPNQCTSCTGLQKCGSCQLGFYFYDYFCYTQCPEGLYGSPLQICVQDCPINTYQYNGICLFSCPKKYFQKQNKCSTYCDQIQYNFGKQCIDCPYGCQTCIDGTNCLTCEPNFTKNNNKCIGPCPIGYYSNEGCKTCPFKCESCSQQKCLTCRGDRTPQNCECKKGYYDDGLQDQCQQCPCLECESANVCTKCKNNLQTPNCSCDRFLNDGWCITCDLAKVQINFNTQLTQLIIDFGYIIGVNLDNPFQQSYCNLWFVNHEILGTNSLCYQDWNRTTIYITLGEDAQVKVGDTLQFKPIYKDISIFDCAYIQNFMDPTVYGPSKLIKPYIEIYHPQLINPCQELNLTQTSIIGTGSRKLIFTSIQFIVQDQDYIAQLDSLITGNQKSIYIPLGVLRANYSFAIEVKYTNMFNQSNSTIIQFKTNQQQKPYIYFQNYSLILYIFDCFITYQNLNDTFIFTYIIKHNDNEILSKTASNDVQLDLQSLPKGIPLQLYTSVAEVNQVFNFQIPLQKYYIQFLQKDRFVSDNNQINSRAYDPNVLDQVSSTLNFTYQWICITKQTLMPCKNAENQIIQLSNNRIARISDMKLNTTLIFYVKAIKNGLFAVNKQTIIITNLVYDLDMNSNQVQNVNFNLQDDLHLVVKNNQNTIIFIQDNQIIAQNKINSTSLRIKLSQFKLNQDPLYAYLLPGNQTLQLSINEIYNNITFNINPQNGKIFDYFYYNVTGNNLTSLQLYYYYDSKLFNSEIQGTNFTYGKPLLINNLQLIGNFTLPFNSLENQIYIVAYIKWNESQYSVLNQTLQIQQYNQGINNLIQLIYNQSYATLSQMYCTVQSIVYSQKSVCLQQCSGVGTCIDGKCICPPSYYFDDCSGTKEQFMQFKSFIQNFTEQLLNQDQFQFRIMTEMLNHIYDLKLVKLNSTQIQNYLTSILSYIKQQHLKVNEFGMNLKVNNNEEFDFALMNIQDTYNPQHIYDGLKSTLFAWDYIATNNDTYLIEYSLRQVTKSAIQFTLSSMLPQDTINYTYDASLIIINKSQHFNNSYRRLLTEEYDYVQLIYLKNLYSQDGYFPYPDQFYPLFDYQISQIDRSLNINITHNINYSFIRQDETYPVCLTRDPNSFEWTNKICQIDLRETQIWCNCTQILPTTIADDINRYYQDRFFILTIPNIIFIELFCIIGIIILLIIFNFRKDAQYFNTLDFKYGKALKINKHKVIKQINIKSEIRHVNQRYQIYNFHQIHNYLGLIYKTKAFCPRWFRGIIIILRLSICFNTSGLIFYYNNNIYINLVSTISIVCLTRIIQYLFQILYKRSSIEKDFAIQLVLLLLSMLMATVNIIIIWIYNIKDQTYWFIYFNVAFIFDFIMLDFIYMILQKYLGQETKRKILSRIQKIKKNQQLQREFNKV